MPVVRFLRGCVCGLRHRSSLSYEVVVLIECPGIADFSELLVFPFKRECQMLHRDDAAIGGRLEGRGQRGVANIAAGNFEAACEEITKSVQPVQK